MKTIIRRRIITCCSFSRVLSKPLLVEHFVLAILLTASFLPTMVMAWVSRISTPSSLSSSSILRRQQRSIVPVSQNLMKGANGIRGSSERRMSSSDQQQKQPSKFVNHFVGLKDDLHHRYFALRHGQSLANVAGLIASDPEVACQKYGLSDLGKDQARSAGKDLVERFLEMKRLASMDQDNNTTTNALEGVVLPLGIAIISSDLLRAKETAQIVADTVMKCGENGGGSVPLYQKDVIIETRLRERYFGEWDLKSDDHYADVWKDDALNPLHEIKGVESVWSVVDRSTRCVVDWDTKLSSLEDSQRGQWWVICVAHGDVLQIMQTGFSKTDPSKHRSLPHLETATLRPLPLSK
mmetsp:Transcript_4847/g.12334  ORF Transcript_4847/g.12334 Transcript_4847/m.12334 type:complete len:352 (+) Transcript_4847:28-1083(+)